MDLTGQHLMFGSLGLELNLAEAFLEFGKSSPYRFGAPHCSQVTEGGSATEK